MLQIDQVIHQRYRIDARLGQGGMGAVYRAYDINLEKPCVVKLMLQPDDPALIASAAGQFKREARVLANLRHHSLPRVTDYFIEQDNYYLVMDLIEGQSLDKLIGDNVLPEPAVLGYAAQLLDVLEYLHAQGILHRDIKPANIIVQPDGNVVLVDFGLVKVFGGSQSISLVHALTPQYAPPEQYQGNTDARSDLYALAATLYHALAGQPPTSALDRISGAPLPLLRKWRADVSVKTEHAIHRALSLNRAERYPTAAAMRAALKMFGPPDRRLRIAIGTVAILILLASSVFVVSRIVTPPPAPTNEPTRRLPTPVLTAGPTLTRYPSVSDTPGMEPSFTPPPIAPTATSLPAPSVAVTLALIGMQNPPAGLVISPDNASKVFEWTSLRVPGGYPVDLSISPGGNELAVNNGNIEFYNLQTLIPRCEISPPGGASHGMAFASDWSVAATMSSSDVRLWNPVSCGQLPPVDPVTGIDANFTDAAISMSRNAGLLAVRTNTLIRIIDLKSGHVVKSVSAPGGPETGGIALSPDGSILVVSSSVSGNNILLWDTASWQQQTIEVNVNGGVRHIVFSPDGKDLAADVGDSFVIWDVQSRLQRLAWKSAYGDLGFYGALAYSPNGLLLASGHDDGTVRLWRARDGHELAPLVGHSGPISYIVFAPNGTALVTTSQDQTVRIWGLRTD